LRIKQNDTTMKELRKEERNFYECNKCNRTSFISIHCPCAKKDCEAQIAGTLIITHSLNKELTKEQEEWNERDK